MRQPTESRASTCPWYEGGKRRLRSRLGRWRTCRTGVGKEGKVGVGIGVECEWEKRRFVRRGLKNDSPSPIPNTCPSLLRRRRWPGEYESKHDSNHSPESGSTRTDRLHPSPQPFCQSSHSQDSTRLNSSWNATHPNRVHNSVDPTTDRLRTPALESDQTRAGLDCRGIAAVEVGRARPGVLAHSRLDPLLPPLRPIGPRWALQPECQLGPPTDDRAQRSPCQGSTPPRTHRPSPGGTRP
ncbi:hypothetical protein V565_063170 [Rhizoctonia solani 123E]|uniref:Uncharacterized protein n=1 Tax=Rhizoctonia solani 123E TaxID=1423351 RepID=A0A074S397_9AGAM|nr:hypothetical protein V565_063170 [Rhizoctonia solani 123E]